MTTAFERDLFVRLVHEMADSRVNMLPVDSMAVVIVVITLGIVQQARTELSEETAAERARLYKEVISEQWALAVQYARNLMLSEEALKRVLPEQ